jgi:hypothetical protein
MKKVLLNAVASVWWWCGPSLPKLESAGSASTGAFSTPYLNCVGKGTFQFHLKLLCYGGLFVIPNVRSPFLFRTILIFNDHCKFRAPGLIRIIGFALCCWFIWFVFVSFCALVKTNWIGAIFVSHHPYSIALSVYHHIPIH